MSGNNPAYSPFINHTAELETISAETITHSENVTGVPANDDSSSATFGSKFRFFKHADSDEVGQLFRRDVGHAFRFQAGHAFRFQAGHDSDLKSAT
ncbi:hypothetical protein [Microvirga sp. Mcv34]|uniref:hypothetical protein n=1 Tax=Microvirga sp. Mcv34 TaxID=2926016 RepID=UPI0021C96AEB|nr:hypothetical protein [Microvirga sp. Mcv34]